MKFTFKHLTGSRAGQEQAFDGSVVGVGRNPTNQIAFDPTIDDRVSGSHAQLFVMDDGTVTVNDLGSRNGTFVNGKKVTGPTPVPSGAIVEFGSEGGPKVLVTYVASAPAPAADPAAAPAAPPPKSGGGGKGCMIGCVVLLMLGMCLALAYGGYVFFGRGEDVEVSTATDAPDEPAEVATTEAPPATEAPPPPTATEPPPRKKIAWARVGVGSVFEMKSVTEMKMGEQTFNSESTLRQTLTALDDTHATVKTEVFVPNVASPDPTEQKLAIYPDAAATGEQPEVLEEKAADVEVPAGKFSCTYRRTKSVINGQEMTMETWHDEAQPLPYKSVVVTPTSRTVTELTKIEKK